MWKEGPSESEKKLHGAGRHRPLFGVEWQMKDGGKHIAYISAGSNIGDKLSNCQKGFDSLARSGSAVILTQSPFYKTEPVDYTDQDWFVNAAAKIETGLGPLDLLRQLKAIEKAVGRRESAIRFGPRVLDLDIIMYDDVVMELDGLCIPHPRMHQRRFVLQPICDIDPDALHPVFGAKMRDLLKNLGEDSQRVVPCL